MSGMLNSLLDINQLEAGVIHPEFTDFAVNDLLERMKAEFAYDMQAHVLEWRVIPSRLAIRSDPRLLEQMVRNLLSNAVKYTRKGGVLLGCRRRGARVRIEMWDTGLGIPEGQLRAIFKEFHQIDNPSRERSQGLGLGLAIVYQILQAHKGQIRVDTEPGLGTEFVVEIPRSTRATARTGPRLAAEALPPAAPEFQIVVAEADHAERDHHEQGQPDVRVARIGQQDRRNDG